MFNLQDVPPHLRRKAARLVSAKCCLAARIDSFHESLDATLGRKFLEEIEKKLDKMQEPPPVKEAKALPRPDDPVRQKRGGRRVRKMKEKFAVTEMRRQANRMKFGELGEDVYQSDIGYGVGTLGKDGSGKVRNPAVDKKTQVSISKRLQVRLYSCCIEKLAHKLTFTVLSLGSDTTESILCSKLFFRSQ